MKVRRALGITAAVVGSLTLLYGCTRALMPRSEEPARVTALPAPIETVTFAQFSATLAQQEKAECRTRRRRAGHGTTDVTICAYQGAQYIGGARTSNNGDIVAQLTRDGNAPDDRWSMERTPIEYYMVLSQRNNVVSFHMVKMDRAGGTLAIGSAYEWVPCTPRHTHRPPWVARASFRNCGNGQPDGSDPPNLTHLQETGAALLARLSPVSVAFASPSQGVDSPEWVDCEDGCCTGSTRRALSR